MTAIRLPAMDAMHPAGGNTAVIISSITMRNANQAGLPIPWIPAALSVLPPILHGLGVMRADALILTSIAGTVLCSLFAAKSAMRGLRETVSQGAAATSSAKCLIAAMVMSTPISTGTRIRAKSAMTAIRTTTTGATHVAGGNFVVMEPRSLPRNAMTAILWITTAALPSVKRSSAATGSYRPPKRAMTAM